MSLGWWFGFVSFGYCGTFGTCGFSVFVGFGFCFLCVLFCLFMVV